MEEQKDIFDLLDMMVQPVFCVKGNRIIRANAAAQQQFPHIGESILPLLDTSAEAYGEFSGGCLYLPLTIEGQTVGASVRRMNGFDVFELDNGSDSDAMRTLALVASTLRKPLSSAMAGTATLLDTQEDPEALQQLSQLNRNLYQLLRLVGNMSDAEHLSAHTSMETVDVTALFREIFEKAQILASQAQITLSYEDLKEPVFTLANRSQLERAVLNLLSNAMKFTAKSGYIAASLVRRGQTLRLTIQDSGSGIDQAVMGNLFQRYLRQPGIEDSRNGLGLGLHLVHSAALHHGGTLLLSQKDDGGTCVVLTIAIRQKTDGSLRSPIFEIDYAGGFDHCLVELSDCLPFELFDGSF